jgi:hypothetical protein
MKTSQIKRVTIDYSVKLHILLFLAFRQKLRFAFKSIISKLVR